MKYLHFLQVVLLSYQISSSTSQEILPTIEVIQKIGSVSAQLPIIDSTLVLNYTHFNFPSPGAGSVIFRCESIAPIEWIFEGPMHANDFSIKYTNYRLTGFHVTIPKFLVELKFMGHNVYSTGNYSCRHLGNTAQKTSVFVFVEGDTFFYEPGNNSPIGTGNGYLDRVANFFIPEDTQEINLPILSNLFDSTSLTFFKHNGTGYVEILRGDNLTYNSRKGLYLNLAQFDNPYAQYYIRTSKGIREAYFRLRQEIILTPNARYIDQQSTESMEFTCESSRNFSMVGVFNLPRFPEYNPENEYPFKITLKVIPSEDTEFESQLCCTELSNLVPTPNCWYFTSAQAPQAVLSYDPETQTHTCCADLPINTVTMNQEQCRSIPECRFRQVEILGTSWYIVGDQCASRTSDGGYILSCGARARYYEISNEFAIMSSHNNTAVEMKWDDVTGTAGPTRSNSLIAYRVSVNDYCSVKEESSTFQLGDRIRVHCAAELFYFANDLKLAFQYENGTVEDITESNEFYCSQYSNNYVQLNQQSIVLDSINITGIICYAPRWDKVEWENVTIPLTFNEQDTTSTVDPNNGSDQVQHMSFILLLLTFLSISIYNI